MSEAADDTVAIEDSQPDRLIKYRLSPDKFSAQVLLPGLWYTDFDKKLEGKWSLKSIARTGESVRYVTMPKGFIYYFDLLADNKNVLFMAANTYSFEPALHDIRYLQDWGSHLPLRFQLNLIHLGETTFTLEMLMFDNMTGKHIASGLTKFVYVNLKNRRAVKLPDWFVAKAQLALEGKQAKTISRTDPVTIPPEAFKFRIKALHSDCDGNRHVNQSIFISWCSDAASLAAVKGHFTYFKTHIELYRYEHVEIRYSNEIVANETADVYTWEDKDNPRLLHFSVRKDGREICSVSYRCCATEEFRLSTKLPVVKL